MLWIVVCWCHLEKVVCRAQNFSHLRHCCWRRTLWGPPNLLSNGYQGHFPRGKAAGACSWLLTSNWCQVQENVDLYIHSLILLHGIVLSYLSTGTTLPYLILPATLRPWGRLSL
jgi:hypothetical protein